MTTRAARGNGLTAGGFAFRRGAAAVNMAAAYDGFPMSRHLKTFSDGSRIEFGRGQFDDWCVYLLRPGQPRTAPRDAWYFGELKRLAARHGAYRLYEDFVQIYDRTGAKVDESLMDYIGALSAGYGDDALEVDQLLSIVYAGMVAEENKRHAPLRKRVKRLGMYQSLIEGWDAELAAGFSRGKEWQALDAECGLRGF